MLMSLSNGRVDVCLEGGYNLKAISKSSLAVTRVLMGEPPDRLEETRPTPDGLKTVQMVAMLQSKYWPSLEPKDLTKGTLLYLRLFCADTNWSKPSPTLLEESVFTVSAARISLSKAVAESTRCYSLLPSGANARQVPNDSSARVQRPLISIF